MPKTRGVVDPLILLVLLVVIAAVIYLVLQGVIPNPLAPKKEPTVQLQTQYQNPFEEKTQYVNPFSSYKNPFDTLK